MMCLPEIPWDELRLDYFKGKRSQRYLGSNGVHQFEKRLQQTSIFQSRVKELLKEYKHKYGNGSKSAKYVNNFTIKEFGKWWSDEYVWLEDKYLHS